jgi:hypothetical protein
MTNSRRMAGRSLARPTAAIASKWSQHRLLRNVAVTIGLSGALLGGVTAAAQASQVATISPGQSQSFSTWFFGRTEVCFQDLSSQNPASYYWVSATSSGAGEVTPGSTSCVTRSFVGFNITVTNETAAALPASISVTFPIGP